LVEFTGTPGINPALNIEAVTRFRSQGGEPLAIFANVGGTLMNPRVRLSTDAQPPIAESDLISYLLFGRPSYALASAETTTLEGALGAGVSRVTGSLAAQLGTVVGRQIGFDYFNITQAEDMGDWEPRQGCQAPSRTRRSRSGSTSRRTCSWPSCSVLSEGCRPEARLSFPVPGWSGDSRIRGRWKGSWRTASPVKELPGSASWA
jgi:hypothetical protein